MIATHTRQSSLVKKYNSESDSSSDFMSTFRHMNTPKVKSYSKNTLLSAHALKKYTMFKTQDRIDILVKIYRKNVLPQFPNGGKFTPYLETLEPGAKLNIQGPFGLFGYKTGGTAIISIQLVIQGINNTNVRESS